MCYCCVLYVQYYTQYKTAQCLIKCLNKTTKYPIYEESSQQRDINRKQNNQQIKGQNKVSRHRTIFSVRFVVSEVEAELVTNASHRKSK